MPSYDITNSRGSLVTTIGVGTTTGSSFPVEFIGQGISLYGSITSNDIYWMLEHFANDAEPANPVEGMIWYNSDPIRRLNYYDGNQFVELSGASSNSGHAFDMLSTASNVDFTVAGSVDLFTAPSTSNVTHHITNVILIPTTVDDGGSPPITPATFNIYIDSSEDVLENCNLIGHSENRQGYFPMNGMSRFAEAAETVKLEIVTPATGSAAIELGYDVVLFGYQDIS